MSYYQDNKEIIKEQARQNRIRKNRKNGIMNNTDKTKKVKKKVCNEDCFNCIFADCIKA